MKAFTPYLNFDGNCREAMTFYQQCLGGELQIMPFGDAPFDMAPEAADRVLHACLSRGSTMLMASDVMPGMPLQQGNQLGLHLECESDEEVQSLYTALSDGGTEEMAPHDAFWGARFAMFTDRFGMSWMLHHTKEGAG